MYKKYLVLFSISFLFGIELLTAQAPLRRLDTTMKAGKAGYRLNCTNRSVDRNLATITPIGFDKDVREFSFEIRGRVTKAEVDDINRDGFPDLVFYVYNNNDSIPKGTVIGVSSENNETVSPIIFPDIYDDPKLRIGYKGYDEFFLMEGYLVRRFPVFSSDSTQAAPAKKGTLMRQIQYMVVSGERGGKKFKPMRSYEFTKQ